MDYNKSILSILHWNCNGLNLQSDKCKLDNHDFYQSITDHDLVLLSETHCHATDSITVKGYGCFQLNRSACKGNNRSYGGLAVLYRNSLRRGIKFLDHKNVDYVWIKFLKEWFGFERDYYMCYAYIPPREFFFLQSKKPGYSCSY
jgi:exonuclease III